MVLVGCAPLPQRAGIPTRWQPSPNFDERRPSFVIIHHTGDDTVEQALRTLTDPQRKVSAHYLIGRDGTIYQLVDERARAWHAGQSLWGGASDLNSASLGIELDNNGQEPFPERQIASLLALLGDIKERHHIPKENFLGHADIAPTRKVDPSHYFPWKTLADYGFGLWCDSPPEASLTSMDAVAAIRRLGYDVSDSVAAIRAFKQHFDQQESSQVLTRRDQGLLY